MQYSGDSTIGGALFTKTQQRVLGILYGDPENSYYLNEIVRIAQVGKGSVMRELDKLCHANLLILKKIGNQSHYQANPESSVFNDLKGMIRKTVGAQNMIRAALIPLMDDLQQAFIYGNYAAGDESVHNDINLLLVSDRLTAGGANQVILPLQTEIGRKIEVTILTRLEYGQRIMKKQSFIRSVMEQPKIWLLGKRTQ